MRRNWRGDFGISKSNWARKLSFYYTFLLLCCLVVDFCISSPRDSNLLTKGFFLARAEFVRSWLFLLRHRFSGDSWNQKFSMSISFWRAADSLIDFLLCNKTKSFFISSSPHLLVWLGSGDLYCKPLFLNEYLIIVVLIRLLWGQAVIFLLVILI